MIQFNFPDKWRDQIVDSLIDVVSEKGNLKNLIKWMDAVEYELRTALFCTGSANIKSIRGKVL